MLIQKKTLYAFEADEFEEINNLSLCMEEPRPDADNPIITGGDSGEPADGKICYTSSVERLNEGYGMWYQAENTPGRFTRCLATSTDGFNWKKQGVIGEGLFNTIGNSFNVFNDGDRFLAPLTALGTKTSSNSPYAALQPEDISDERRRIMVKESKNNKGRSGEVTFIGVATSSDGLHWAIPEETPRIPMMLEAPWIYRFRGQYIMAAQTHGGWFDPPQPGYRKVAFFTSDDLIHWDIYPHSMTNDAYQAIGGQTHVGIIPIKCIDDRLLIGLGGRFDDGPELPAQHFDITILYSKNGLDWKPLVPEHERRNWIRRGRRGEWDFGGVVGMGLVENGDQAAIYYNGTSIGNASHSMPLYDPGSCQVGRVCFPRDRFAAL